MADGVVEEVVQDPRHLLGGDLHAGELVDVVDETDALEVGVGSRRQQRVGDDLGEADRPTVQHEGAAVDP